MIYRACVFALVLVAPCLGQAATAAAEIRNLKFTLTDLDPNDGYTPSLEVRGISWLYAQAQDWPLELGGGPPGSTGGEATTGYPPNKPIGYLPLPFTTTHGGAFALADIDKEYAIASGHALGPNTTFYASVRADHDGTMIEVSTGPNTLLTVTGEVHASVSGFKNCGPIGSLLVYGCESAYASAQITLTKEQDDPNTGPWTYSASVRSPTFSEPDATAFSLTEIVPFTFTRGGAEARGMEFALSAYANATSASPVPEPASYLMGLLGLGCLALVRRGPRRIRVRSLGV